MSDYAELTGLFGLATGDSEAALSATSRLAVSNGRTGDNPDDRIVSIPANFDPERLEAIGFTIMDELPASQEERNKSFVRVQMPEGWSIHTGADPRLRNIFDERGVKRVTTTDNGQWWDRYVSTVVVRQGYEVLLELCYGGGDLESVLWDRLTDAEQEDAKQCLRERIQQGKERPTVYADTTAKAQMWLDRIEALAQLS